MGFHSKGSSISRSARTSRRDKESILGLSGWLFADLLLAIAVIFLVVQDRPAEPGPDCDEICIANLRAQIADLSQAVEAIGASKGGLIASADKQLTMTIPGGAIKATAASFASALYRSELKLGKDKTSFGQLKDDGYRIGFVIWFARDTATSKSTFKKHFGTFVSKMHEKGLVIASQYKPENPSDFPVLPDYQYDNAGKNLFLRIFLFKVDDSASS
jgi:hypothetical protein